MNLIVRVFGFTVLQICNEVDAVEYDEPPTDLGSIGIASEVYAGEADRFMGFTNGWGYE